MRNAGTHPTKKTKNKNRFKKISVKKKKKTEETLN